MPEARPERVFHHRGGDAAAVQELGDVVALLVDREDAVSAAGEDHHRGYGMLLRLRRQMQTHTTEGIVAGELIITPVAGRRPGELFRRQLRRDEHEAPGEQKHHPAAGDQARQPAG